MPAGNLPPLPVDHEAEAAMAREIPVEQRKTFFQLGPKDCKWPVGHPGTPEFFFCGDVKTDSSPYCSFHYRMSLPGPSDRRVGAPFRMIRNR